MSSLIRTITEMLVKVILKGIVQCSRRFTPCGLKQTEADKAKTTRERVFHCNTYFLLVKLHVHTLYIWEKRTEFTLENMWIYRLKMSHLISNTLHTTHVGIRNAPHGSFCHRLFCNKCLKCICVTLNEHMSRTDTYIHTFLALKVNTSQ